MSTEQNGARMAALLKLHDLVPSRVSVTDDESTLFEFGAVAGVDVYPSGTVVVIISAGQKTIVYELHIDHDSALVVSLLRSRCGCYALRAGHAGPSEINGIAPPEGRT